MHLRFYFLFLLVLTGCSTAVIHLPSSRFESPEAPGETWLANISFGAAQTHDVTVVQDASARPPTIGKASVVSGIETPLKLSVGLWERLEVGLRGGLLNSPYLGYAKFQILGTPEQKAKNGNFSLAVTAAAGAATTTLSGDQQGTFGPGGFPWKVSLYTAIQDFAAILGMRVSDAVLIYSGAFITKYSMSGSIHDDVSSNNSSPAADYFLNATGENRGINLGVRFGAPAKKALAIIVEGVASNFGWTGINNATDFEGGLFLNWTW